MNLSENLKKIRKDNNLSQEQFAEKLGVSRQSVSKWENGEAYPEMDKVLQICKMFNLNIDELLNQDIKKVNEEKQSKINIDKYVGDFLDYITKTINLFSSMKFKDKIKCLFEQCVIALSIFIIALVIGTVGSNLVHSILFFIPNKYYYDVYNIFSGIYLLFAFIVGTMLLLHIFKVRYLDYYVVVESEEKVIEDDVVSIEEIKREEKDNKKIFSRNEEKVIIRDPKHSRNNFISLLVRSILFMIKCFVFMIGMFFSFTLVCLAFCLVLSFLIAKSGFVFIGTILIVISGIAINLIILNLIYNFLKSIKSRTKVLLIIFISSLILVGLGGGLFCIGLLDFKFIDGNDNPTLIQTTEVLKMSDDLFIDHWSRVEFVESSNNDLKIVYTHPSFYKVQYVEEGNNGIWFNDYDVDVVLAIKSFIDNFNDKKLIAYNPYSITVYTTKENIDKLKENKNSYYHNVNEENLRNYYENRIEDLENYIDDLESRNCDYE